MAQKRKPTNRRAAKVEGPDMHKTLPNDLQQILIRDIFGTSTGWVFVEGYRSANPGKKLLVLRQLAGLTQAELAERADVSQTDVSRSENDPNQVAFGKIKKICEALGVPAESLLADNQHMEPHTENH
ncbi:MAG: helix-turn-helix transcriptional regulator [Planctomycetota bacterium]